MHTSLEKTENGNDPTHVSPLSFALFLQSKCRTSLCMLFSKTKNNTKVKHVFLFPSPLLEFEKQL
jgi:hypothetical protein